MDIYKLLEKTNCGKCGMPTCMSFALSVVAGEKAVEACPFMDPADARRLSGMANRRQTKEGFSASINELRARFVKLDLQSIAKSLGAEYRDGSLTIHCLVKDFSLNSLGELDSECHINTWMETLLLSYCLSGTPGRLSGRWVSFSELRGAATAGPYFQRRCETPLKAMADTHGGIFFDLLRLFGADCEKGFAADIAMAMHPLPKVPIVVIYSRAEEEMESTLRVLFDSTAADYLGPEVITLMGRGLVEMFQKIITKHEGCLPDLLAL